MAKKRQATGQPSEFKTFPFLELKRDDEKGIVEHLIAVHGVLDLGKDISEPGSWSKTINERGLKVRVLDMHNRDSIMDVIGKPLSLAEIGKDKLPEKVLERWPEATGAVAATTQFLMDTPEGKGAFIRIRDGAVDEFSYGYDPIKVDYQTVETKDGDQVEARLLKEIAAWEYGPVIWGMNPATMAMSAKDIDGEEKATYDCECLSCGHTMTSSEHCKDVKCPECGGEMRRAERPGKGDEEPPDEEKVEVTENYVRIPADSGDHSGHRIRTMTLSAEQGIKALYCGECKKIITYLFDKDKWDVERAKKWVAEHKKGIELALQVKWTEDEPEDILETAKALTDIKRELVELELLEVKALEITA